MSKNYVVYKSDLKYKKFRNIDESKMEYGDDVTEDLFDKKIDLDTIEYRYQECRESKYYELDLCHMELKDIPNIPKDIKDNLVHLFLFDNCLTSIDLKDFKVLKLLDISNNKISELKNLPESIIELFCPNNELSFISFKDIPNLERLNCNNNKIKSFDNHSNLKILHCVDNKISEIPDFNNLTKLYAYNNKISKLPNLQKLDILDISKNNIHKINNNNISSLICNDLGNIILQNMNNLSDLEMFNTKIDKLDFFPKLFELYCDKTGINEISDKYKINNIRVQKEKFYIINFSL